MNWVKLGKILLGLGKNQNFASLKAIELLRLWGAGCVFLFFLAFSRFSWFSITFTFAEWFHAAMRYHEILYEF